MREKEGGSRKKQDGEAGGRNRSEKKERKAGWSSRREA